MRHLLVLFGVLPVGVALATPKETIDLLFATKTIEQVALAPDGHRLAWVEREQRKDRTESRNSFLHLVEGNTSRRVTAGQGGPHTEKHASWSRDGARLAFLSDAEKEKQLQLYVMPATPAAGVAPRKLTTLNGQLAWPQWSPDGRTIALLFIEGQTHLAGPVEAAAPDSGEVAEKVFEQRVLLVDAASGATRFVTPPDIHVYELSWSPDGREIAYVGAPGSGDNNWYVARLFALEVARGTIREVFKPTTQIAVPRWSPDGTTIAFIQGLMSDEGATGGDIWTVPAAGGAARNLTPARPSSPAWLAWLPSGKILFTEGVRGRSSIATLDPATARTETLWTGDEAIGAGDAASSLSITPDGATAALIRSSWARPPEVWSGAPGNWQQRTRINEACQPRWGRAESVAWQSDGYAVQGWLLYPREYDATKRYPMIVGIHGGPAAQVRPTWPGLGLSVATLSAENYFVFLPNPRGSFGQGEAFTMANVKDFGHGDLRDIMAGIDTVLKRAPVDPARLGVAGWSYGGFMTMWTVTQTNRFRAAVAGAGIANWQSYYGQNLIDQWMIPYFGASVYDDPGAYARSSPINFIKAVRTPTLILVGERDKECPAPQSYEFWHALKSLGVETKFVVYEGEGHHLRKPANIEDLLTRTIAWFDQRLKPAAGKPATAQ